MQAASMVGAEAGDPKTAETKAAQETVASKSEAGETPAPSTSANVDKKGVEEVKTDAQKGVKQTEADEVDDLFGDLDTTTSANPGATDEDIEGWDLDD